MHDKIGTEINIPTAAELALTISVQIATHLNSQVYIVGGAARGDRAVRDVDMVVMGAEPLGMSLIYSCISAIACLYPSLPVEEVLSSDPEDQRQNDARVIFRYQCKDYPLELSFPRSDCRGNIFTYMSESYPLSVQEACFIPGQSHHYEAWGTGTIYVKKWLNYENALKKYKGYYPEAQFIFVTESEYKQIIEGTARDNATYKEGPYSF